MRIILGAVLIGGLALAGCKSEEQKKTEFRTQFLAQCGKTVREQPSFPAGLNADTVCTCVSDRLFAGKSTADIEKIVEQQTGVTEATVQCLSEQLLQAAGPAAAAAPAAPATTSPEKAAPVADAVGEAADDAE